ncbi:DUF1254 domain-containing protein [Thalassotalea litorea]|uniref:DUF1254 domain-containing protein n=1 Tax=Thalassotalea litorea TaxID=2020715 RepID=A0A5R9IMU0_9GAMM|nr:DUF1254 domain-containing protein [Thalassotalea litorea]TLU65387.1 DUF1254 domain-containing protein [Thalassotalea litorea]
MKRFLSYLLTTVLFVPFGLMALAEEFSLDNANLDQRMTYHRSVDAVVWAMPLMNFKFYRDALADAGVSANDVGYFSKLQDWRFQTATPNNTTPYIMTYWNLEDGPIVIEMPPATEGIGIFGTIMDAWQRPLDDVGAKGRDAGRGAKYLMVPPGYDGPLLTNALVYTQETNFGFAVLRPIMAGGATDENLKKAVDLTQDINIYPLKDIDNPPKSKYVDLYGKSLEMTPKLDQDIYRHIHEMINQEVVLERDKAMMGLLARIGIRRDSNFSPDEELQSIQAKAAPEALEYMIEQYHRVLNPFVFEGKKWSALVPNGSRETEWSYEYPSYYDYHARGALYYAIITSVKNYGSATYYLDLAETADGQWLDGGKNYQLTVPANVPVRDFWAVTTYDLETASYLRDIEKSSIDSTMQDVTKNSDGSVTIYFGPEVEKDKETNWLRTDPDRRFFLLGRFYGPEPALLDGSFELNNIELRR